MSSKVDLEIEEINECFKKIIDSHADKTDNFYRNKNEMEVAIGGFWSQNFWGGNLAFKDIITISKARGYNLICAFGTKAFAVGDKENIYILTADLRQVDFVETDTIHTHYVNQYEKNIKERFDRHSSWDLCSPSQIEFVNKLGISLQEIVDKKLAIINDKNKEIENKRASNLANIKDSILTEFDQDRNGIVDVIEGADDFLSLFKKHQKAIIEIDKDYIQKFVKTSNYLKTKRRNIQSIFENFQQADTHEDLENRVGILKNDIHAYEVLLMHSLNMIMTLVSEDMITFYEIYESFDKLNVFNSNWENEVSGKLSDIGDGLNQLIYSVNKMNQDIVQELSYLSYTTEESFQELQRSVSAELSSINSSIQFGNLLSGIQTYQLHKINKRGDNLLK